MAFILGFVISMSCLVQKQKKVCTDVGESESTSAAEEIGRSLLVPKTGAGGRRLQTGNDKTIVKKENIAAVCGEHVPGIPGVPERRSPTQHPAAFLAYIGTASIVGYLPVDG